MYFHFLLTRLVCVNPNQNKADGRVYGVQFTHLVFKEIRMFVYIQEDDFRDSLFH